MQSKGFPTPTLSEAGALPGGVTFTPHSDGTATLAGTPATGGSYVVTITAANGISPNATQSFTLSVSYVLSISPAFLPGGTVRTPYNQQLTATGGVAPYRWALAGGSLPSGLRLNANTGTITGETRWVPWRLRLLGGWSGADREAVSAGAA